MSAESSTSALIRNLEARRHAAMLAADIPALDELLSDRLVYTHSNASVDDKASYLAKVAGKYFDYQELSHPEDQLIVNGNVALVTGRMRGRVIMEGRTERQLNNRTLTVWVKEEEAWRMVAFQPTPIL